ncbi:unnamed protein product [Lactuca virosa]|uniref:Uncharacterized protein n=1 Tax=Lactuca virosa TaxID=75947 RepID=A0AAU9LRN2_9ASTR|nr:unnamed protein product [Lactuca virosa]
MDKHEKSKLTTIDEGRKCPSHHYCLISNLKVGLIFINLQIKGVDVKAKHLETMDFRDGCKNECVRLLGSKGLLYFEYVFMLLSLGSAREVFSSAPSQGVIYVQLLQNLKIFIQVHVRCLVKCLTEAILHFLPLFMTLGKKC